MTLGRIVIIRDDHAPIVLATIDCPHSRATRWPDSHLFVCHECGRTISYDRDGPNVIVVPAKDTETEIKT